jgi:hypothetical protein
MVLGTCLTIGTASCAPTPELPETTKSLAVCAYNTLKTMPGITKVDAFEQRGGLHGKDIAVIGYALIGKDGKPASGSLDLLPGPTQFDALNLAVSAEDKRMVMLDQPSGNADFFGIGGRVAKTCQAGFGYIDQVIVTFPAPPPPQKVDMARFVSAAKP